MKKTDVYVVVDTPKKAKKLKEVLDIFGEKLYRQTRSRFQKFDLESKYNCIALSTLNEWVGFQYFDNKTEVSIKELRNILAKEHLKEADVVIASISSIKYIAEVKSITERSNGAFINAKKFITLREDGSISEINNGGAFSDFIRYATEEEKALLEPKKELEVGKWYKSWNDSYNGYDLSYYTGTGCEYGSHSSDCWCSEQYWIKNTMPSEWQEATPQEVEQALIEEAKRRYKVGDKLSEVYEDCSRGNRIFSLNLKHQNGLCDLWINDDDSTGYCSCIFKNGKWATVIEQDKFAELKEAHRNGAVIQWRREKFGNFIWEDCTENKPAWVGFNDYRIKPEENPTLNDKDVAVVERLHDALLDNHGYSLGSKLLTDARMLVNKIKSNIK